MENKLFMGIGIGASRIKIVSGSSDFKERNVTIKDHYGDPQGMLQKLLSNIDPAKINGLAVTGREGALLRAGKKVYESEAIEECLRLL
ncbi:hypothetical protein ACFLS1_12780, partial [Verrucomicrobiota bacterium]